MSHSSEAAVDIKGYLAVFGALLAHYEAHIADHTVPYPGCLAALDALAERGCRLAVITNKIEVYSRKLAELRSLCVAPEWQGRGIGRRLVERCLALARERLVFEVMAITSQDQFFRACGFDFTLPGEKKALFYQTRDNQK